MSRRLILGLSGLLVVAAIVAGVVHMRRPRPVDPVRVLFEETIPRWQLSRLRPEGKANGDALSELLKQTAAWPSVAAQISRLDAAWPDEAGVREATTALNGALRDVGLRYFLDQQRIQEHPMLLTYEVAARVPWQAGASKVEVQRLRRLDHLNIEMGMLGETEGSQPLVLLDRLEASLVRDLPLAFSKPATKNPDALESAAMFHLRRLLESAIGPTLATSVDSLRKREELLESMRQRFHRGTVQLQRPDGFVMGEAWFENMERFTDLKRLGGPLLLDTDLRAASRADEAVRDKEAIAALQASLDFMAQATEAHEAHHALAALDTRVLPPPGPLIELMEGSAMRFQVLAEHELRAYLGELSDSPVPACLSLLKLTRAAFGRTARATPHFYAGRLILTRLSGGEPTTPAALLDRLCALPDAELRKQVAATWQWLYGDGRVPARRQSPQ